MTKNPKNDRGRAISEGHVVKKYLNVLAEPPRRGRPVTTESVESRIAELEAQIEGEDLTPVKKLQAIQAIMDLKERLESVELYDNREERLEEAQAEFVEIAASYSERQGISHAAWRAVNVPAVVLKEAGVTR